MSAADSSAITPDATSVLGWRTLGAYFQCSRVFVGSSVNQTAGWAYKAPAHMVQGSSVTYMVHWSDIFRLSMQQQRLWPAFRHGQLYHSASR